MSNIDLSQIRMCRLISVACAKCVFCQRTKFDAKEEGGIILKNNEVICPTCEAKINAGEKITGNFLDTLEQRGIRSHMEVEVVSSKDIGKFI